jgi:hypothetical protein
MTTTTATRRTSVREDWIARMRKNHKLQPLAGAVCPRRVLGLDCLGPPFELCLCQGSHAHDTGGLFDHCRVWTNAQG